MIHDKSAAKNGVIETQPVVYEETIVPETALQATDEHVDASTIIKSNHGLRCLTCFIVGVKGSCLGNNHRTFIGLIIFYFVYREAFECFECFGGGIGGCIQVPKPTYRAFIVVLF